MKTIGLLGGASWVATVPVYEELNREVSRRKGGAHSARILMYSIDYAPIKNLYHKGWAEIPGLFKREIEYLVSGKPDCLMIACNTLHKAFDIFEAEFEMEIPVFHAVRLTRDWLKLNKINKVLFLGTAFTMEDDYFSGSLKAANIELIIPNADERANIQAMQTRISKNEKSDEIRLYFQGLLDHYESRGCSSVILACTELPLVVTKEITGMKIIDPVVLQCQAAVDYVLG